MDGNEGSETLPLDGKVVVLNSDQGSGTVEVEPADRVVVTYYTDPLCYASWEFEPVWQQFCDQYGAQIDVRYVMGGFVADGKLFHDSEGEGSAPADTVWTHVSAGAGLPVDRSVRHIEAPSSSYPACIAVRNAFLQSPHAGKIYLHALRCAAMSEQRDIARQDVLATIASEVAARIPGYFRADLLADPVYEATARDAFRADLQQVACQKISHFPTLTFVDKTGKGLLITGAQSLESLRVCLEEFQGA